MDVQIGDTLGGEDAGPDNSGAKNLRKSDGGGAMAERRWPYSPKCLTSARSSHNEFVCKARSKIISLHAPGVGSGKVPAF